MLIWFALPEGASLPDLQHEASWELPSLYSRPPTCTHTGPTDKRFSCLLPSFGGAIAEMFEKHLKPRKKIFPGQLIDAAGLESVFVTEIVKRSACEVCSAWSWRGRSRINVLELQSTFQAIKKAARSGGGRVVLLLDSHVAARVIAKRRSSAKALQPLLRKICALGLAFGISISVHFLPTRLNVADDPTRDAVLRDASDGEPWFEKLE